jgi:hypothetical protein
VIGEKSLPSRPRRERQADRKPTTLEGSQTSRRRLKLREATSGKPLLPVAGLHPKSGENKREALKLPRQVAPGNNPARDSPQGIAQLSNETKEAVGQGHTMSRSREPPAAT